MASRIGLVRKRVAVKKRVPVSFPKSVSQIAGSGIRVSPGLWNKLLDKDMAARGRGSASKGVSKNILRKKMPVARKAK